MWGESWNSMTWGGAPSVQTVSTFAVVLLALGVAFLLGRRAAGQGVLPVGRSGSILVVLAVGLLAVPMLAWAAELNIPHEFQNGTVANADEVNANFQAVKTAVDANTCTGDPATGDADGDGVCDDLDQCANGRDDVDLDNDLAADDCDPCPLDNPDDANGNSICDSNEILFLARTTGAPAASGCDAPQESGLLALDFSNGTLYVCSDIGWVAK